MANKNNQKTQLILTSGDIDGIGFEITSKALRLFKNKKSARLFLCRSSKTPKSHQNKYLQQIDQNFQRVTFSDWAAALEYTENQKSGELIDLVLEESPALWVERAAQLCRKKTFSGMVTAPLSKTEIHRAGLKDMGHTGILSRVSRRKNLFMAFLGEHFNVLLATGHIPLKDVSKQLTGAQLQKAIEAADGLNQLLSGRAKPMGLVGLNPHAGEDGLIGIEEKRIFQKTILKVRANKQVIEGPLVPDAAFLKSQWKKYSFYICPYHDLGLVAFKSHHGHSGVHVTAGLDFVRTSVDHGTATDLFGKDKANPSSMIEAIDWAVHLSQKKIALGI